MLLLPIIFLAVTWLWPIIWFQVIRNKLELDIFVLTEQVTCEEWVELQVRIRNRSWLPCPFLEFSLLLPTGLTVQPQVQTAENTLRFRTYLFLRQETTFHIKCYAQNRGPYKLQEAALKVNEGFGMRTLHIYVPIDVRVYVSPSLSDLTKIDIPFKEIVGQVEIMRWLFPDEALLRGLRSYQRGDSFKHIAWLASARSGEWMTKQFSSSTAAKTFIVVSTQVTDRYWERAQRELFDPLCTVSIAIAYQLARKGLTTEFGCNAVFEKYPKANWFGLQKPEGIRSLLGKAHSIASFPLEITLQRLFKIETDNSVLFLLAYYISDEQAELIQQLARRGLRFVVVTAGQTNPKFSSLTNVTIINHPSIGVKSELNTNVS